MSRRIPGPFLPYHQEQPDTWAPPTLQPIPREIRTVYLDAETTGVTWYKGDRPVGWAVKPKGMPAFYVPFGHRGGGNLPEERVREWFAQELRGRRICNLNTKFDVNMARAWGLHLEDLACTFHDVAHDAALLDDHRKTFNLDDLAQDRLGLGKGTTGLPKSTIADQPAWQVEPYACRDVELVELLDDDYAAAIHAEDLGRVRDLEDEVLAATAEMEWNGVPFDEALNAQWLEETDTILKDLHWQIYRQAGFVVNTASPTDMTRLFIKEGLSGQWGLTATGKHSFDATVMKAAAKKSPLVALVYRASKLEDLRQKFLTPLAAFSHNGRIRGSLHQLRGNDGGTIQGRFSMASPNLQQAMGIEKYLALYGTYLLNGVERMYPPRQLFRAPAGQSWGCWDQAQVEFRVMGHYAKSKRIVDTYAMPHAAREVDGKMLAYQGPWADFHVVVMDMIRRQEPDYSRKNSKNYNFATGYGAGAAKRASMLGVSVQREAEINALYEKEFPELRQLLKRCASIAETRGYVRTVLGRRSRFPNGERAYKALNAVCQGTAADINKRCIVEVHKQRKTLGFEVLLTVHDELNGILHDPAMAPKVAEILNTQWIPLSVPILWEGGVPEGEQTWSHAK
jgi:DNA polymerase I-like protein with 3'-5' exonuclease and polymerase domains